MGQPWKSELLRPSGCILLALALLILPLRWVLAWIAAASVHECFHLAAVRFCGGRIRKVHISSCGARISADDLSPGQELFCILAGPLGALILLLFARWFPAAAVCALLQSTYNLLPLSSLDGGNALNNAARMLLPPHTAAIVCNTAEFLCLLLIMIAAIYAAIALNLGWMPVFLALLLFTKTKFGKTPCKPGCQRVQ